MRRKILVADPDPGTRAELAEVLAEYGADVLEYTRDEEAYDSFLENGIDVAFIDLLLPRQGGLALLRRIRATPDGRRLPVIVMCAVKGFHDLRSESMENLNAAGYLEKPFKPAQLRAKLDKVLPPRRPKGGGLLLPFSLPEPPKRGAFRDAPLCSLLRCLGRSGFDGRLHVQSGKVAKVLFFQEGKVSFASSNRVTETLGRHLLGRGALSEAQYQQCLERMRQSGGKFGEAVVESQFLDADSVARAVCENVREKVLDLFTWQEGEFALSVYSEPPAALPSDPMEVDQLLWDGIVGPMNHVDILGALRPHLHLYLAQRRDPAELAEEVAAAEDFRLLLEGARDFAGQRLGDILDHCGEEAACRALYSLLVFEYFALGTDPDIALSAGMEDPEVLDRLYAAREELNALKIRNFFRILGVSLKTTDEEVRNAFREKAKVFHPDRAGSDAPPELRRILSESFSLVQDAYEQLKTPKGRADYLLSLQLPAAPDALTGGAVLEAEGHFRHGLAAMRRRDWASAVHTFGEAYRRNPAEPEYPLFYGIALMNGPAADRPTQLHEAKKLFRRAIELDPEKAEPYYRMGLLAKLEGETTRALSYFQLALIRNPRHNESMSEVRLIRARQGRKMPVMFGSFLGKKGK